MDYLVQRKRFRDSKKKEIIHTNYMITIPECYLIDMGIDFDTGYKKDKNVAVEYDWTTKQITIRKIVR